MSAATANLPYCKESLVIFIKVLFNFSLFSLKDTELCKIAYFKTTFSSFLKECDHYIQNGKLQSLLFVCLFKEMRSD